MGIMVIYMVKRSMHLDAHPVDYEPEYFTSKDMAKERVETWTDDTWGMTASITPIQVFTP